MASQEGFLPRIFAASRIYGSVSAVPPKWRRDGHKQYVLCLLFNGSEVC